MKHKTAFVVICFALALVLIGAMLLYLQKKTGDEKNEAMKADFFAMDTLCSITMQGEGDIGQYRMLITRIGRELDRYDEGSEVYRFNTEGSATLSGSAAVLFDKSRELYEQYGLVDITCGGIVSLWGITGDSPRVPADDEIAAELEKVGFDKLRYGRSAYDAPLGTQLDFGAVAKGYALDCVKSELKQNGDGYAVVSLGSSTLLYGQRPDGEPFKTGIKDPFSPDELLLTFESGECFVSTSGGYERYFEAGGRRYIHILDLKTGCPCESDLASVTVICKSGVKSDFLSTAIFIDGKAGLDKYLNDDSIQVIAVDNDKKIYYSPSLEGKIKMKGSKGGGN
ncbi:MAG: FAD:protein FMN transferase [Ruminococcus sp.]|nr:FAD:protein FMN transferase [Ruminococcus sp.]